jgi:hypothetical protein
VVVSDVVSDVVAIEAEAGDAVEVVVVHAKKTIKNGDHYLIYFNYRVV